MPPTPTAGSYRYKLKSGAERQYGDPTVNRVELEGATYLGKQGDPNAADPLAQATPTPTAPISRTIDDTGVEEAEKYLGKFVAPHSRDDIAEQKRKNSQAEIDAINKQHDDEVAQARLSGQDRLDQTNAMSVLSGLTGSTEALRYNNETVKANDEEVAAINNKRALAVAAIYGRISREADTEARQQVLDATKSAEDILARRKTSQEGALNNLKALAGSGLVDFEVFKNDTRNAKVFKYALDAMGGSEEALRGVFAANRPKDQLIGTPVRVGDHFVQAYQNPMTGKVSYDRIDVPGLGVEYSSFQKMGDNLVAIPTGWDGDVSKLKTIAGQPSRADLLDMEYKRSQIARNYAEISGGGSYTTKQRQAITSINDSVSKNATYAKTSSMRAFGDNVITALAQENGVGDIAAINQFQKVIDEGAVTRDQDVKLIQTAQSLASSLKTKIKKLERGDQLSSDQRAQIKTLVEDMYEAQVSALKNDPFVAAKTREAELNQITLEDTILGELSSFSQSANTSGAITVTDPSGGVHTFPDQASADAFKKEAGI